MVHPVLLTSTGSSQLGMAGTPVMKSWLQKGLSNIESWQEGIRDTWSRSKCAGISTTGIWLRELTEPDEASTCHSKTNSLKTRALTVQVINKNLGQWLNTHLKNLWRGKGKAPANYARLWSIVKSTPGQIIPREKSPWYPVDKWATSKTRWAMYVARLHNHCGNGNTALCSLCTVKQPVTSNIIKILKCFTTMLLRQTDVAGNNNMILGLHVNCQYFCPMLIKFQFSSQILKKGPISYFIKIYPEKVMLISENRQMDGHDEGEMCFS